MPFKKPILLLLICGLLIPAAHAQEMSKSRIKDYLNETVNAIDSSAGVAYLLYKKRTHYETNITGSGRELVTDVRVRLKFYDNTDEDLAYATHQINLYVGDENERVQNLEGATYNMVDGKVEKTKMGRDQIFKEDINDNFKRVKFTLPKVKKGSVVEYSFSKVSPYIFHVPDLTFEFNVPAMRVQQQFESPPAFIFNRIPKGHLLQKPQHTTNTDANGYNIDIYTYNLSNVAAIKDEPYVDNIENYRSGVVFELVSFRLSDGSTKSFATTWNDVARTIYFNDDFKKEIGRSSIYSDEIDELTEGLKGKVAKVKAIFNYVKTNFKWDGYYGKSMDKGIRRTFKDKGGDSGDINLLLISMLQYAGIEAKPVFISTKDRMKPFFPTIDKLNLVIALVEDGAKSYFLDATKKNSEPNVMPLRDYNWKGLMVDNLNKKFKLIDLSQPPISRHVTLLNAQLDADGNAHGSVKDQQDNHLAYIIRNTLDNEGQNSYVRDKESDLEDIEISDFHIQNLQGKEEVKQDFTYVFDQASEKVGNKVFFNPLLFYAATENPFKAKTRNFPIDFGFPFNKRILVNIKVPDGFEISSIPKPLNLKYGNSGSFKYTITKNGRFIRLSLIFEMTEAKISHVDYKPLRKFFKKVTEKQSEKVVLTKL